MSWLLRDNWPGSLLAFFLGAAITWFLLDRHRPATGPATHAATHAAEPSAEQHPLADATAGRAARTASPTSAVPPPPAATPPPEPAPPAEPAPPVEAAPAAPEAEFSQLMDVEPTLFDHLQPVAESAPAERVVVPPGRYGEGSADAVPHQGPPDGFTIKGNAQSMLFHTPDSPYYGRTKPQVWFRTEADAERAGFTKYTRRPRKSSNPRD